MLFIYVQLDTPLTLPTPIPFSHSFNKLISCHPGRTKTKLVINIYLPVYIQENFNLHRMYPIPIPTTNNNSNLIKIHQPYLASHPYDSKHRFHTEKDIQACTQLNNITYCPSSSIFTTDISCETSILFNASAKDCDKTTTRQTETVWIRLQTTTQWIFSTPSQDWATLKCKNNEPRTINLTGIGLLKIEDFCQIEVHGKIITNTLLLETSPITTSTTDVPLPLKASMTALSILIVGVIGTLVYLFWIIQRQRTRYTLIDNEEKTKTLPTETTTTIPTLELTFTSPSHIYDDVPRPQPTTQSSP